MISRLAEPLILLAGGKSERAGGAKGLTPFRGHVWLKEQLIRFRAAGGARAIVVLGFAPERYLEELERVRVPGLEIVVKINPTPEHGPFSSIRCGLEETAGAPGVFVQPIDVPCAERSVWQALVREGSRPGVCAVIPVSEGRGGHPVRVSAALAQSILKTPSDGRLDVVLKAQESGSVARVEVSDPSVRMNLNTPADWALFRSRSSAALDVELGCEAGLLSAAEIGLGSFIHAWHFPAGGQLLSLNQAFMLSRATLSTRSVSAPLRISVVTGLLKSLSPAGKKLTPMLAISMQGLLFSLGTRTLGANVAGVVAGAALLSVWAFAQPLLVSFLLFGKSLFVAADMVFQRASEILSFPRTELWRFVLALALAKAVVAAFVALGAAFLPETFVSRYVARLRAIALVPVLRPSRPAARNAAAGALADLSRPLFLLPLALNFAFLLFCESKHATLVWVMLRPLAAGYALFLCLRLVSIERLVTWLAGRGFGRLSRTLQAAIAIISPGEAL